MANEDKCLELPRTDAATDYFVKDQFKDADTNGDGKLIGQEWGAYVLLARAEMLL